MKAGDPRGEIQQLLDTVATMAPRVAPSVVPRRFAGLKLTDLVEGKEAMELVARVAAEEAGAAGVAAADETEQQDQESRPSLASVEDVVLLSECDLDTLELRILGAKVRLRIASKPGGLVRRGQQRRLASRCFATVGHVLVASYLVPTR